MTDRLTKEQEDALRAADKAATPGPWESRTWDIFTNGATTSIASVPAYSDEQKANALFIALARNHLPALLKELEALRGENTRLTTHIDIARAMIAEAWSPPEDRATWDKRSAEESMQIRRERDEKLWIRLRLWAEQVLALRAPKEPTG